VSILELFCSVDEFWVRFEPLWQREVVAGPVGAGKSTVARLLLARLRPIPALLDKDTMYNPFDEAILTMAGRPLGEREGPWYDEHIKQYAYAGLTATAREVRAYGCPVLLSGPFTKHIHDAALWHAWVERLGGGTVRLVWVRTDAQTLRQRLERRNSPRDAEKLRHFEDFVAYMQPETPPPVAHVAIDNRLTATDTLAAQIARLVVTTNA
jgi:predicted kinase